MQDSDGRWRHHIYTRHWKEDKSDNCASSSMTTLDACHMHRTEQHMTIESCFIGRLATNTWEHQD